jgi:hypothetical protein
VPPPFPILHLELLTLHTGYSRFQGCHPTVDT